ncbi:MAG: hypothetical protein ABIU54_10920 [Candidatus Eisenbacteria bacterium]
MNAARTACAAASAPPRRIWASVWPWLFWALWGAWLAVSDLRNNDVQAAVIQLFVGAAVLGAARPGRWWVWALAMAAWIAAEPLLARIAGIPMSYSFNWGAICLPPIPALLGAALGKVIRRSVSA